jgi:hypothetical protein
MVGCTLKGNGYLIAESAACWQRAPSAASSFDQLRPGRRPIRCAAAHQVEGLQDQCIYGCSSATASGVAPGATVEAQKLAGNWPPITAVTFTSGRCSTLSGHADDSRRKSLIQHYAKRSQRLRTYPRPKAAAPCTPTGAAKAASSAANRVVTTLAGSLSVFIMTWSEVQVAMFGPLHFAQKDPRAERYPSSVGSLGAPSHRLPYLLPAESRLPYVC